jgi:DNA-binding transcriptional regulator YiaG
VLKCARSSDWVAKHREKLDLSAADYAALVGVSALTIYSWEHGKTRLRSAQLEAWRAIRNLGKREAWRKLGG